MPHSPSTAVVTDITLDRPIVLVGLMGVGKSTVGRRVAARLGIPFVDADDEIEAAAGMSISEIFSHYGEAVFRDGERRVIRRLLDSQVKVIATGGGAFIQEETRALILEHGLAIWLHAEIDILVERTGRRDHRPLLKGKNPGHVLAQLAATRNPLYALAPIHIRSEQGLHEIVVESVLNALRSHIAKAAKPAVDPL